jgi:hypothetical protein
MDIHEIALSLFTEMVGKQDIAAASDESRIALGREAYRYAEAFVAARDAWIFEQPVPEIEPGY